MSDVSKVIALVVLIFFLGFVLYVVVGDVKRWWNDE